MKELCVYLNIRSTFNIRHPGADTVWWWQIWGIIIKICSSILLLICFSLESKTHFPKDSLYDHYLNKRFQENSKLFQLVGSLILTTEAITWIIILI
jgi:hypothetical protein